MQNSASVRKLDVIVDGLGGNATVIGRVPGDANVALLSPVGRPCVLDYPILLPICRLPIPAHVATDRQELVSGPCSHKEVGAMQHSVRQKKLAGSGGEKHEGGAPAF